MQEDPDHIGNQSKVLGGHSTPPPLFIFDNNEDKSDEDFLFLFLMHILGRLCED